MIIIPRILRDYLLLTAENILLRKAYLWFYLQKLYLTLRYVLFLTYAQSSVVKNVKNIKTYHLVEKMDLRCKKFLCDSTCNLWQFNNFFHIYKYLFYFYHSFIELFISQFVWFYQSNYYFRFIATRNYSHWNIPC